MGSEGIGGESYKMQEGGRQSSWLVLDVPLLLLKRVDTISSGENAYEFPQCAGGSLVIRIRILECTWIKLGHMGAAYICVNVDLSPVLQFHLSPRLCTPEDSRMNGAPL